MQPCPMPLRVNSRTRPPSALVASADGSFRQRLNAILTELRWEVREAAGGAEAWTAAETNRPDALIVDAWLPDLSSAEFAEEFRISFPQVTLVRSDGSSSGDGLRGWHRQELLYALRRSQETDGDARGSQSALATEILDKQAVLNPMAPPHIAELPVVIAPLWEESALNGRVPDPLKTAERLPELIGNAPCMLEVSRRIRLVASRSTPVLIEGPTGSGKELVAEALHRLSNRNRKPFVAINCAAIPEALLEAELFGHTRGAFTGAVQGRVGRIEAADGGTLFLDEIGEMPLALQSKLLRFVECGELQRIGDNETLKVDVRILAATHQPLAQHTQTGGFRADLYYRLAVFLIRTPALSDHIEDLPDLVTHFLSRIGREMPVKRLAPGALARLTSHSWPGNVRELAHVLERGEILAGDDPVLTEREIDFGSVVN